MKQGKYKIGIVGSMGQVGSALKRYFQNKPHYELFLYDKYKNEGSNKEVNKADVIYICVPTPNTKEGGCDVAIVDESISHIEKEKIIVIKSTVIPGTTDRLQIKYPQHKILCNPEFLTEETADQDMSFPDRQIVGYTDKSFIVAKDIIQQLPLAPFERIVPAKVAEMCKYFGNSWFATKVIFANQMYDICQKAKIDYDEVRDLVSADKRIGRTHLTIWHRGGRGAGGKCLPKDLKALIAFCYNKDVKCSLLEEVNKLNDEYLKKSSKM